jgi:hypothetical protein
MFQLVLTPIEREVMSMLLAGDDPDLHTLTAQFAAATAIGRELTGVGFFVDFQVPSGCHRLGDRHFVIGDVIGELDGLQHGAGFLLFVRDGIIKMLEGFSYDEPWPEEVRDFKLTYVRQVAPDGTGGIAPTATRDWEDLVKTIRPTTQGTK